MIDVSLCTDSNSHRSVVRRRRLANNNKFRQRRDIRKVSPQTATSYNSHSDVDDRALVNRLQDKASYNRHIDLLRSM